jgi:hypothetical protein
VIEGRREEAVVSIVVDLTAIMHWNQFEFLLVGREGLNVVIPGILAVSALVWKEMRSSRNPA